jgi:VanZ family protein
LGIADFRLVNLYGVSVETPLLKWRLTRSAYKRMQHFLKNWLPVLAWIGVIFVGSTDLMSAEHTSRFIVPFLRWLNPDISVETLTSIHFILRKCAHVGEYAVLGLLLLRAATLMTNFRRSIPILYVSVLGVSLFVAITDEFHQTFVASRGPSMRDIMIDSGGAILGLLIGAVLARKRSTKLGQIVRRATNV